LNLSWNLLLEDAIVLDEHKRKKRRKRMLERRSLTRAGSEDEFDEEKD
jgi:hypothetical protein